MNITLPPEEKKDVPIYIDYSKKLSIVVNTVLNPEIYLIENIGPDATKSALCIC
jgi:hypothetical protein